MDDENEPDPVLAKVGELITIARTSRIDSPSIPKLAASIGIDVKTLRSIENGRSWPQDKNRRLIESSLQLRPGWLSDAKLAITDGWPVPTAVPANFIQSLGIFYVPHLGRADTDEDWNAVKMQMRSYCDGIAASTAATTAANAIPANQGYRPQNMPTAAHTGGLEAQLRAGFSSWPWPLGPEINYLSAPRSRQVLSHTHDSRTNAALQQISDEHNKTAAQIMQALRISSDITTTVVNAVANENRSRIDYVAAQLRNTLADMAALAAAAPEQITDRLEALVAHAHTAVDVLTGDKPQPLMRPITNKERMELADHLTAMLRTALEKRGQEISRGDTYNAAIAALKDVKVVDHGAFDDTDSPTDVVAEILANPKAHGIDIDRTADLWSAHRNPQPRSAAQTATGPTDTDPPQASTILGLGATTEWEPIATAHRISDCAEYPYGQKEL